MRKIFAFLLTLASVESYSAVSCGENVTSVILHSNGNVYFKTDQTCTNNWCQITWTGEGDKDRALSVLLTARATEKKITFYWQNINACSEQNVTYASPGYFSL